MSKTDKTRPTWVKAREHLVEVHNHENGVCDIAGATPCRDNFGWSSGRRCYFSITWWHPTFGCGCELCGISKDIKRRARRAGKRQARSWWREL